MKREPLLDYFFAPVPCPGGGERYVKMAFGTDGTMWIDPADLGIRPEHAPQLDRFGGPYVLVKTDPEWGKKWLAYVEEMIAEHKAVRERFDARRNN